MPPPSLKLPLTLAAANWVVKAGRDYDNLASWDAVMSGMLGAAAGNAAVKSKPERKPVPLREYTYLCISKYEGTIYTCFSGRLAQVGVLYSGSVKNKCVAQ